MQEEQETKEKQEEQIKDKKKLVKPLLVLIIILCFYFGAKFLVAIKSYQTMDRGTEMSTITLTGHGEVTAVPDIASIDFTIRKEAKTAKEAQDSVAQVEKKAIDFLKSTNIDSKDFKVTNASFNPKYEYKTTNTIAPCTPYGCPPSQGKSVIVGYESYESINVKIRNTDEVGKIMQGLSSIGVENLNGPNFTIDNQDTLQANARKQAIDDAETKAQALAKDLNVRLGKITSFNESGNYPTPIMYKTMAVDGAVAESAPAQLPKGENTISSDVTITYQIK